MTGDPARLDVATIWAMKAQGRTIDAIKAVREATGWGLAEAKAFVDAITQPPAPGSEGVQIGVASGGQQPAPSGWPAPNPMNPVGSPFLSPAVLAEVWALNSSGRKIDAIKLVREATGWGLKEAKDYVERMSPP